MEILNKNVRPLEAARNESYSAVPNGLKRLLTDGSEAALEETRMKSAVMASERSNEREGSSAVESRLPSPGSFVTSQEWGEWATL